MEGGQNDPALAKQVRQVIEHKKQKSVRVPYEKHLRPPLLRTLRDNAFRLLTPYY